MKKVLFTILAVGLFAGIGSGLAQSATLDATHDLTINIPELIGLRIVDSSGALASTPGVTFDFVTDPADTTTYTNMVATGGGELAPTGVTEFADLQVLNNASTWSLTVVAGAFTYSPPIAGMPLAGVDLADITIKPAPVTGVGSPVLAQTATIPLSETSAAVANGSQTAGWTSVGVSGNDYWFDVNGDENPGTYTTTVTYTLTAP